MCQVSGVTCHRSGVMCQMSGVMWHQSIVRKGTDRATNHLLVRYHVSLNRCHVSHVKCQVSTIRCQMLGVTYQTSGVMYHLSHGRRGNSKSQHIPLVRCHVRYHKSGFRCRCPVSHVPYPMSHIRCHGVMWISEMSENTTVRATIAVCVLPTCVTC